MTKQPYPYVVSVCMCMHAHMICTCNLMKVLVLEQIGQIVFRLLLESLYHCRWSWDCQAFSDYQMQQMTSNFIDQFGFNDEKFADQDDIGK